MGSLASQGAQVVLEHVAELPDQLGVAETGLYPPARGATGEKQVASITGSLGSSSRQRSAISHPSMPPGSLTSVMRTSAIKRSLESPTRGGLIVLRLTPLSIVWKIASQTFVGWSCYLKSSSTSQNARLISVHAGVQQCTGLERHVTKPVVLSEMTVVVAPPFSWSVR